MIKGRKPLHKVNLRIQNAPDRYYFAIDTTILNRILENMKEIDFLMISDVFLGNLKTFKIKCLLRVQARSPITRILFILRVSPPNHTVQEV